MSSRPSEKKGINWVAADKIRALFNKSQYYEKIKKGLLQEKVVKKTLLKYPKKKGEPQGTYSEIVRYREPKTGFILYAHRYKRPDGSIGASGKPDPKFLQIGGKLYKVQN